MYEFDEHFEGFVKNCEGCGKPIGRHVRVYARRVDRESWDSYMGRKYCSHECSSKARSHLEVPPRYCLSCGRLLVRKLHYGGRGIEPPSKFRKRQFCDQRCHGDLLARTPGWWTTPLNPVVPVTPLPPSRRGGVRS